MLGWVDATGDGGLGEGLGDRHFRWLVVRADLTSSDDETGRPSGE